MGPFNVSDNVETTPYNLSRYICRCYVLGTVNHEYHACNINLFDIRFYQRPMEMHVKVIFTFNMFYSTNLSGFSGNFNDANLHTVLNRDTARLEGSYRPGQPRFQCDQCTYSTEHRYRMTRHQRIHRGDYFTCDLCSNRFTELSALRIHLQIHQGIALRCTICGEMFPTRNALSQHRAMLHNKKLYYCKYCDKSFVNIGRLEFHHKNTHGPV